MRGIESALVLDGWVTRGSAEKGSGLRFSQIRGQARASRAAPGRSTGSLQQQQTGDGSAVFESVFVCPLYGA